MLASLQDSARDWAAMLPRPAKLTLLALVIAALGVLAARHQAGSPSSAGAAAATERAAAARTASSGGAVMLRRSGSAVIGTLRSTDGATAAAISYVQQRNALLSGGTSAQEAAQIGSQIALGGHDVGRDPASIPDRAALRDPEAMLATRAGQIAWWTVPFAFEVRSYSSARATVRVFSGLLSAHAAGSGGPPVLVFSLLDTRLVWREAGWRIEQVRLAADQPSAALAIAVDTRAQTAGKPVSERLLASGDSSGAGLFAFLQGAAPVLAGPEGMGPIDGRAPADRDAQAVLEEAAGAGKLQARRQSPVTGRRQGTWRSIVPVAFRAADCPVGAPSQARCVVVLMVGTGLERSRLATAELALVAMALSDRPDGSVQVSRVDLPLERQQAVLGSSVQIAGLTDRAGRDGLAAWKRSVLKLHPVLAASAR